MPQRPRPLQPTTSVGAFFGAELRHWRTLRGLSQQELGLRVHVSGALVAKVEKAERTPTCDLATRCDAALATGGVLGRLWPLVQLQAGQSHTPRASVVVRPPCDADTCRALDTVEGQVTEFGFDDIDVWMPASEGSATYAATPLEQMVHARRVLVDSDNLFGPRHIVSIVHRQVAVAHELRSRSRGADRRAMLETQTQFAEFASWLHQDLGEHAAADYWLDRALQWTQTLGDQQSVAYVMARKAQLAADMGLADDAVELASAAHRLATPKTRVAAAAHVYVSLGHALRGGIAAADRGFDQARETLDSADDETVTWAAWMNTTYIDVHQAQTLDLAGRHDEAAERFHRAHATLPGEFHRDAGVYLARHAVAAAGAGAFDDAATLGKQALTVGRETGSGRILAGLVSLSRKLSQSGQRQAVAGLRHAIDDLTRRPREVDADV